MGCISTANNKEVNLLREEKVFDISSVFIHSHGIFDKLLCFMSFAFSLFFCFLFLFLCFFFFSSEKAEIRGVFLLRHRALNFFCFSFIFLLLGGRKPDVVFFYAQSVNLSTSRFFNFAWNIFDCKKNVNLVTMISSLVREMNWTV